MLTIVKKNDSYDAITYQLENEDNSTVDLTGASVNFVMGKKNKLITNAKATVTSATSGIVSYQLTPLDTLVSGTFLAEFVVTFANGTTKTYPSNGYITVDVEQNLDTSQNNVVLDMIATKQGDFEAKLDSILKQGIGTQVSAMNEYTWTATSGQTIFVFPTNAKYDPSAKWFQVSVGNVPIANELINRASSSQFSLVVDPSLIVAGMTVHAMWVEPIVPITGGHHSTHEINGQDEINIANLRNYQELVATPIASNTTALATSATVRVLAESFTKQASETDDTARLQRAIDKARDTNAKKVMLEGKTYNISSSINLYEHIILEGQGQEKTIISSTATDFAFLYTTNTGSFAERQAPHFRDLKIIANNGIKLNDPTKGFTDANPLQEYILRPLIERCSIEALTSKNGIGIQWSKCFDGRIINSKIQSFDINVDLHGSDICSIKDNRIVGGNYAVKTTTYGTFGTQTLVDHNDLLSQSKSFINTTDNNVIIRDNYMEAINNGNLEPAIVINSQRAYINNNRIEANSTIPWLRVDSVPLLLDIRNTTTTGSIGNVQFMDGLEMKYLYNSFNISKIIHSGIVPENGRLGIPYSSLDDPICDGKTVCVISPSTGYVTADAYGNSLKVSLTEKAWKFPAMPNYGSITSFYPKLSGNFNIGVVAKASTSGQKLYIQRLNGETVLETINISLTDKYTYTQIPFTGNTHTDLKIKVFNDNTTSSYDLFIKKIVVDYA
jgi:hypothetical protein